MEDEKLAQNVLQSHSQKVDKLELGHIAHSRAGFAEGAVMAAEWLIGRQGVYGMKDMLNL